MELRQGFLETEPDSESKPVSEEVIGVVYSPGELFVQKEKCERNCDSSLHQFFLKRD